MGRDQDFQVKQVWQSHGPPAKALQQVDSQFRSLFSSGSYDQQAERLNRLLQTLANMQRPNSFNRERLDPLTLHCLEAIEQFNNPQQWLLYLARLDHSKLRTLFLNSFLWKSVGSGYEQFEALLHLNGMSSDLENLDDWSQVVMAIPASHAHREKFATAARNIVCMLERGRDRERHHDLLTDGKLYLLASEKKWAVNWLCKACLSHPNSKTLALAVKIAQESQGEAMQMLVNLMIEEQHLFSPVERLITFWPNLESLCGMPVLRSRIQLLLASPEQFSSEDDLKALCSKWAESAPKNYHSFLITAGVFDSPTTLINHWRYVEPLVSRISLANDLKQLRNRPSGKDIDPQRNLLAWNQLAKLWQPLEAEDDKNVIAGTLSKIRRRWISRDKESYLQSVIASKELSLGEKLAAILQVRQETKDASCDKALFAIRNSWAGENPADYLKYLEGDGAFNSPQTLVKRWKEVTPLLEKISLDDQMKKLKETKHNDFAAQMEAWGKLRKLHAASDNLIDEAVAVLRKRWAAKNPRQYLKTVKAGGAFKSPEALLAHWKEIDPLVGKPLMTRELEQLGRVKSKRKGNAAKRLESWKQIQKRWGRPNQTIELAVQNALRPCARKSPQIYLRHLEEVGALKSFASALKHEAILMPGKTSRVVLDRLVELCQKDDPASKEALSLLIDKGYLGEMLSVIDQDKTKLLVTKWRGANLSTRHKRAALSQVLNAPQIRNVPVVVNFLLEGLEPSEADVKSLRRLLVKLAEEDPLQAHALQEQAVAQKIAIPRRAALSASIVKGFRKKGLYDEALAHAQATLAGVSNEQAAVLWKALLPLKNEKPRELYDLAKKSRPHLAFWHTFASDAAGTDPDLAADCLAACRSQRGSFDSQKGGRETVAKIIRALDNNGRETLAKVCPNALLESGLISPSSEELEKWELSCDLLEHLATHLPADQLPRLFYIARIPPHLKLDSASFKGVCNRIYNAFTTGLDRASDKKACYPGLASMIRLFIVRNDPGGLLRLPKEERVRLLVLWACSAQTAKDLQYFVKVVAALQKKRQANVQTLLKTVQLHSPETLTNRQWHQLVEGLSRSESESTVFDSSILDALSACSIRYRELCSSVTSKRQRKKIVSQARTHHDQYLSNEALKSVLAQAPLARSLEGDSSARLMLMYCEAAMPLEAMKFLQNVVENHQDCEYEGDPRLLLEAVEATFTSSTKVSAERHAPYIKGVVGCLARYKLCPQDMREELRDMLVRVGQHLLAKDTENALVTLQDLSALLIGYKAPDLALALVETRHKAAVKVEAEKTCSYDDPGVIYDILLLNQIEGHAIDTASKCSEAAGKLKRSYLDDFSKLPKKDPHDIRLRRVLSLVCTDSLRLSSDERIAYLDSLRSQALKRRNFAGVCIVLGRQLFLELRGIKASHSRDELPYEVIASYMKARKLFKKISPGLVQATVSEIEIPATPNDQYTAIMICQALELGMDQVTSTCSKSNTHPLLTEDKKEREDRQLKILTQLEPIALAITGLAQSEIVKRVAASEVSCQDAIDSCWCHVARMELLAGTPQLVIQALTTRKTIAGKMRNGTYQGSPRDVAFLYRDWLRHIALIEPPEKHIELFPQLIKEAQQCNLKREDASAVCELAFQQMLCLAQIKQKIHVDTSAALWDAIYEWKEGHCRNPAQMYESWLIALRNNPQGNEVVQRATRDYTLYG